MALESFASVGVCSNALATGLRLSKRNPLTRAPVEPVAAMLLLLFFQPFFSSPCFSSCTPPLVASAVLPTCCVTYASPADHTLLVTRAGVVLKGLAQFSTATLDDPEAPLSSEGEKITDPPTFLTPRMS